MIMRKNLIGIANLYISTIVLLNAGTFPTVWYIFFHFIIGYEKNPAEWKVNDTGAAHWAPSFTPARFKSCLVFLISSIIYIKPL
jgi:ABC-type anion transport system duplicated permease subunit